MKTLAIIVISFFVLSASSQVIPSERRVDWGEALKSCDYVIPMTEVNVMDFGAKGDGITDDQAAVVSAISSLGGSLGYIYFPPGDYLLKSSLVLPDSTILKGFSSDSSKLFFDFSGTSMHCIIMYGSASSAFIGLDEGYVKDSTWILSDSAFIFSANDYAEIIEDNGSWDDNPQTWAANAIGQMVRVERTDGDTIFLQNKLRITYESSLNPRIRKISPRVNSGIECLKIKRLDQSTSGSNISLSLAANCMVRGIESDVSVSAHIDVFRSTRILIEGNYIHHSFLYDGSAKHGYGVVLNAHAGECLVTNNIFRYLRHAMMVKLGANGNVFSYNYSREVNRSELFSDYGGDISLHGHYPFANLFEGNIVQNIILDHYYGPAGPYNTIFRNWAQNYGIIMTSPNPTSSDSQHIIGNDVTYNGLWFVGGPYSITGSNHIEHGNNIDGTITPSGTGTLNDTSYYLDAEPGFWSVADPWPSLGIPNILATGTIPAKERWDNGDILTVCPLRREWTGSESNSWSHPHNWEPYGTPDKATDVIIPTPNLIDPVISDGMSHQVRSIFIEPGADIEISNGSELKVLWK